MKRLLQHLLAHVRTADEWIMIYDNRGTFPKIIGDCILLDSHNPKSGVFLGVPVWRECLCKNEQLSDVEFYIRVKREYLGIAIARVKELMGSCV